VTVFFIITGFAMYLGYGNRVGGLYKLKPADPRL
jgi:hypothetical protein